MSDLQARGSRHVWNPMSRMSDVLGNQRIWVRGEGSMLYDEDGRAFLDACASLWYANVGYGRREIADAVAAQLTELHGWMMFGANLTPPAIELAERLADLTPGDLDRTYFTCGGSEAVEMAIKIARQYFRMLGQPGRHKVIARKGSYHGSTFGALSATGTPHNRRMFEPLVPGFRHVDPFSVAALEEAIAFEGPQSVAAVIVDPISAASGIEWPPDDYLPAVRRLCSEHGILLIADEVICGFGRTGTWFAVDHFDVVPDLVTMAKGLTSGYLPLGAVACSAKVVEPFAIDDAAERAFMSGNTYAGHAACCIAGLVNIEIIEREELLARSAERGAQLHAACSALAASPAVAAVRGGRGLAVGVELHDSVTARPAELVAAAAYARGVLVRPLTPTSVTLSPPLVITSEEVARIAEVMGEAIAELEGVGSATVGAGT